jgi:predicted ArsR family transcriptional regulator
MQIYICINSIISFMKLTTRLKILDHIRKYQTTTASELSSLLGMTGSNIRHHLAILESTVLVEVVGQRKEGRGRPTNVYGLSRRMLGDGLDELASILLVTLLGKAGEGTRNGILKAVAKKMAGGENGFATLSIPRQLTHAVNRLNELHYQAHWEASSAGPKLILGHCPYSAIIKDHPELCTMDAYLVEAHVTVRADQTEKLQPSTKGLAFCAFQLRTR